MVYRLGLFLLALPILTGAQQTAHDYFPVDPTLLIRALQGSNVAFSATAEISGRGPAAADNFDVQLQFALREGWLRTDLNLAQLQGLHACEIAQGKLARQGFDEVVFVSLPDLEINYFIYPKLKAYYEMPHTWRDRVKAILEIEQTPLGPARLGDDDCEKYRLRVVNHLGQGTEVLAWFATAAGNFPVQLQFHLGVREFTIRFRDLRREPPALDLFQPPADYDPYRNLRELTQARRLNKAH
jgi:hypothetical protein